MQRTRAISFINKESGLVNTCHHHDALACVLLSQACTSLCCHEPNKKQAFFSGAFNQQAGCTRGPALSFINKVVGEPSPRHSLNQQSSTRAGFLSSVVLLKAIERFPDCAKQSAFGSMLEPGTYARGCSIHQEPLSPLWFLGRGHRDVGVISLTRIEVVVDESSLKPRHLSYHLRSNGKQPFLSGNTESATLVKMFGKQLTTRRFVFRGNGAVMDVRISRCSADTYLSN